MTLRFMLGTNIISALMIDPTGSVSDRIEAEGEQSICCSIIVASELRYAAGKKL